MLVKVWSKFRYVNGVWTDYFPCTPFEVEDCNFADYSVASRVIGNIPEDVIQFRIKTEKTEYMPHIVAGSGNQVRILDNTGYPEKYTKG